MGAGQGEVYPAPAGEPGSNGLAGTRNADNYRITDADKLADGPFRRRFARNVAAIKLLREIEAEARPATPEEKSVLVKYVGWGGLPQVFAPTAEAPQWADEQAEIRKLLTDDEYTSARATVLNAHYTAPEVVRAVYAAIGRFGFAHGRILEPACGLGHFFGLMPEEMRARSELTGVEIDGLTARLAKMLYPGAEIKTQPFEETTLPSNAFDLAISNVPFGDYSPFDPRLNARKYKIHDYFFIAAMERVRPGGLIAFVTSRGTMDKQYPQMREAVTKSCDLMGAIRLPDTAFKRIANTEVTTDIIFLRKRLPGEKPSAMQWQESRPLPGISEDSPIFINEYYHARPEMMLGVIERAAHGMYGRDEVRLVPDKRALSDALPTAVQLLPAHVYKPLTAAQRAAQRQTIPVPSGVKPNAFVLTEHNGGSIAQRDGNELRLLTDLPAATARRLRRLILIRDAARACLRIQLEDRPEAEQAAARFKLGQDYDYFVGQFGPISDAANSRVFAGDPDLALLLSLENYDEARNTATKTAIFRERTIQHRAEILSAGTAKEALLVTLNEKGRVDLDHMAKLLGKPEAEFLPDLRGTIFLNPATNSWEAEDHYLSGNVREKLRAAERIAGEDPRYAINAEALRAVQPADLSATEIDTRLGSAWLPASDIADFARALLKIDPAKSEALAVYHMPERALWTVELSKSLRLSVANQEEWGTPRMSADELLESALNLRTPTIYDYDEKRVPHVNATATEAARDKQQRIKDRFTDWIWEDDARRERLVAFYNREFNTTRLRAYNGDHLTLPGASPSIALRGHQKAAVWRILQSPNTLLAHVVGAGKTYAMAAAAMELKRLGLARKPMFAVPNHMLGQFSSELLTLYPNANILAAGKEDFGSDARRELMSRIATNNWDAVIVTHSGFERLPMSVRARREFFDWQLAELEDAIMKHSEGSGTRMVKELERAKKRLEAKMLQLSAVGRKDDTLTFEELGVDRLFVDEAQSFKNLFYVTKMTRIAGLPQAASERAFDMFLKTQFIQKQNGGAGVVFATGTPITNTMAELYTMMRYLQMDELKRRKLEHFDAWAGTFGEPVTAMELAPDGSGYRVHTRFARFVNVPELMQMFRQVADVQTADMLKLPIPELEGGKPKVITAPATPELKQFVAALAKRAEKLKSDRIDPRIDNMLKITSEGRKAALDLRLMRSDAPDHPNSKVNLAVKEIFAIWQETREQRLTQLVFCDQSTPHAEGRRISVYQDIKAKLVRLGIPPDEIQFIHDHDSDASKLALFRDIRSGRVRVTIGSTEKMGAGTNVQRLLVAKHDLDPPWRPADIAQRDGRILRQGNTNPVVKIYRYVTEGSFDGYSYQTLETKVRFIVQIMTGGFTARKIEDLDSPALTFAEIKAIASGNPAVVEKAKVDAEVMRLSRLRAEHAESQYSLRNRLRIGEEEVKRLERERTAVEKDLAAVQDTYGDRFTIQLDGKVYTDRAKAGAALIYLAQEHSTDHLLGRPGPVTLGEFAGFRLEFRSTLADKVTLRGASEYVAAISPSPVGTISSLEHAARSVHDQAARSQQHLDEIRQSNGLIVALVGKVFEHEEHYRNLIKRQGELVAALDLTKNQASSRQGTETSETEVATTPSTEQAGDEATEDVARPGARRAPIRFAPVSEEKKKDKIKARRKPAAGVAPTDGTRGIRIAV